MGYFEIALIAIGLSLDVFAATVCQGAMMAKIDRKKLMLMGFIFCLWQLAAVLLGDTIARIPIFHNSTGSIQHLWQYMSAIIFIALAVYMLVRAFRRDYLFEQRQEINFKRVCLMAVFTSLDAFFAGIGFGFMNAKLRPVIVDILAATILLAVGGTYTGYRLGYEQRNKAYGIGGTILAFAGLEIFVKVII